MVYRLTYFLPDVDSEAVVRNSFIDAKPRQFADLFEDIYLGREEGLLVLKRLSKSDGYYFGFGDKVGPLNRKGRKYTFWNTDNFTHHPSADPLYKSFPFFIFVSNDLETVYGCFTDYPGWMEIDIDSDNNRLLTYKIKGSGFFQYIITGEDIKDILAQYINLTGKNVAFPIWAFGYQQSRWSYFNEEEVINVAAKLREKRIPCDVIYLDIDYMEQYKVFTWNSKNFPHYRNMLEKLHSEGFKVISILDPGVKVENGYEIFEKAKGKYFLKDKSGNDFEGAVWPGRVRFPDFRATKVRRWWSKNARKYLEEGIDGFWNDMNEIAIFATEKDLREAREWLESASLEDGINLASTLGKIGEIGRKGHGDEIFHIDRTPHWKVRNTYGLNMTRATSEMIQKQHKKRPFLITRSAYSGIQRYGGVWTGDNHSWWEHILQEVIRINSLSLSGVFYSGFDVGGFGGDVNAQMLIRYMQLGLFSPMFRNHSAIGTKRQEPWEFGKSVENILRSVIEYRYRLIPYIYTQYMVGLMKNVPLVRPMVYDFKRAEALSIEDQFMFGEAIVVAPVYRPDVQKRLVWLPSKAINIFDGKIYKKGWNVVDTPIEYIPAFQLINTAIPTAQPQQFVEVEKIDKIVWNVFLGKRAKTWFYEDDGVSLNYKKGIYNLKKIIVSDKYIEIQTVKNAYETRKRLWEFRIIDKRGEMKTKYIEVGSHGKYTIQI